GIIIFLVVLVIINGQYLRPQFKHLEFLHPILGSLPNFVGSFILFTIVLGNFIKKSVVKNGIQNIEFLILFLGFLVFLFLTIEEYYPFFTASKVSDNYDIIANAIGVISAYILFKFLTKKLREKRFTSEEMKL